MPQIQSKKYPHNERYVDPETWNIWKKNGWYRRFTIVDDHDMHATITAEPILVDFVKEAEKLKDPTARDEVKAKLDKLGVWYQNNAPTTKLLDLLNENESNQNEE